MRGLKIRRFRLKESKPSPDRPFAPRRDVEKTMRYGLPALAVMAMVLFVSGMSAQAGPFVEGTILVTLDNHVYEFTREGSILQTTAIPYPTAPPAETARDLIVDERGHLEIFNGTHDPYLSRFNPVRETWRHNTQIEWSTLNDSRSGGVGTFENFVFVTDMRTGGDEAKGIVRFDIYDYTGLRFGDTIEPIDLNVGLDGWLYGLDKDGVTVDIYDPIDLDLLGTLRLPVPVGALAVNPLGEIFAASPEGFLYHFNAAGVLVDTLSLEPFVLLDIDNAYNGELLIGTRQGEVIMTLESFPGFTSFTAGSDPVFVAFSTKGVPIRCSAAEAPGAVSPLYAVRQGFDVTMEWPEEGRSLGGYHVYRLDDKTLIPSAMSAGRKVIDTPAGILNNAGSDPGAVYETEGDLLYYQVMGVCWDGMTEGGL